MGAERVVKRYFLVGVGLVFCADPSFARTDEEQTSEIVVTGGKLGDDPRNEARSLQVLAPDELIARGIGDVTALTKVTPGLTFSQSTYGVPVYSIRGIGYFDNSIAASPAVAIYSDEAPLPYSVLSLGAGLDLAAVEIAKGPQGTLFGQNSTGGAINFVSAKPTARFAAGLISGVDTYGLVSTEGYLTRVIHEPAALVCPELDRCLAA